MNEFRAKVLAAFPQLQGDFDEDHDLPHVQMGSFARLTQSAKGAADWDTYAKCTRIADDLLACADPELENALYVSYLEHLDFEGPRGPTAWSYLTPRLQAAWKEMDAYLKDLFRNKR